MENWGLIVELAAVAVGLTCVFLAGRGKVLNFWFGYLNVILLTLLFVNRHLYFSLALQPLALLFNIIGHYRWTHPKEGEENRRKELKISCIRKKPRILHYAVATAISFTTAICMGWLMLKTSSCWPEVFPTPAKPYLDAFVVTLTLMAQYLSAQKHIECWYCWLAVNSLNIILYILAGLVFMPCVSACYLVLAVLGLISWRKQMKEQ